jgi:aryl-alcohol dehydrogenase-like predicted oxidoreductase
LAARRRPGGRHRRPTADHPAPVALARLLAKAPHIVPIPGSRKIARIQENLAAADVQLIPDQIDETDQRSAALTVIGDRGSGHESYR